MDSRPRPVDFFIPLETVNLPPFLLDDATVSSHAVRFAAQLGRAWLVNTMTHRIDCPPTLLDLAVQMGVGLRTVERAARELRTKEYLVISKRGRGSYLYMFRAPQLALFAASDPSRVAAQRGPEPSRVAAHYSNDVVSNNKNDDEENVAVVALKKNGVTDKQVRTIRARGQADQFVCDWTAAKPDFIAEHGPLRKPWAAVLVAALTAEPAWPLPDGFARRRQLELRAASDLELHAARSSRIREEQAGAAIAAPVSAEDRRAQLPENMRRRLSVAGSGGE